MDNQNQNLAPGNMRTKKKVWVVVTAVIVLIFIIGGWFVWENYWSPDAKRHRQLQENIDAYNNYISNYEAAMKADTYGGKTPQETLDMFVDALKKGDMDLASKYFALDTNQNSPDYLTRKKWQDWLSSLNDEGLIKSMITDIENKSKPDLGNNIDENDFKFILLTDTGIIGETIDIGLNKYSQVWKIESM